MICIINTDLKHSQQLSSIFKKYSVAHVLSNDEHEILSCDKIIIPDTSNVTKSLRKLKLMNLMSVLRLITNPILGINQGMLLMCNKFGPSSQMGLGLIHEPTIKLINKLEGDYSIVIKKEDKTSLIPIESSLKYYFKTDYGIPENINSKSIVKIADTSITASYSRKNIYGIQMCLDNRENTGHDLLLNFIKI